MKTKNLLIVWALAIAGTLMTNEIVAQGVTLPQTSPSTTLKQTVGISTVTIEYSRPNVVDAQGQDRSGNIWGNLVPYGFNNLGFGTAKESPWRAGANENTKIKFSDDAMVEGKPLAAGTYGLHMVVQEEGDVTVIFSKNSTAWGSYFYDPSDDALRVNVKWEDNKQTNLLTYNFTSITDKEATIALDWEKKRIPFKVAFDTPELVFQNLKRELESSPGFTLDNWMAAANYLVTNNIHLEDALNYANAAVEGQFFSQKNFATLQTKARVLTAMGKDGEAAEVMNEALDMPSATINNYYAYGRQLISQDQDQQALEIFKKASKKWKDHWLAPHGLARGYSATGEYAKALKLEKQALAKAPEQSKSVLEGYVKTLEENKDFN